MIEDERVVEDSMSSITNSTDSPMVYGLSPGMSKKAGDTRRQEYPAVDLSGDNNDLSSYHSPSMQRRLGTHKYRLVCGGWAGWLYKVLVSEIVVDAFIH